MIRQALRAGASESLVFRSAVENDFEALSSFMRSPVRVSDSDIWKNPVRFKRMLNDSKRCAVLCEDENKQLISIGTGRSVDNGSTLVSKVCTSPDVTPTSCLEERTRMFCLKEGRKRMSQLQRFALTADSKNAYQPALQNGESPYRLICERIKCEMHISMEDFTRDNVRHQMSMPVKSFHEREANDFCRRVIHNTELFPGKRIILDDEPYRLIDANVRKLVRRSAHVTASFGNGQFGSCSGLAFGISCQTSNSITYSLDYSGMHTKEVLDHVISHLTFLKDRFPVGDVNLLLSSSDRIDHVTIKDELKGEFVLNPALSFTFEVPFLGFLSSSS